MRATIALIAFSLVAATIPARAEMLQFSTVLSGANEKVPNTVPATGTAAVMLDTNTKTVSYRIEYSGLTAPPVVMHFHGLKGPGMRAPEVIMIRLDHPASPVTGIFAVTDNQIAELKAGAWYANIHTRQYPDGEIRGWLKPTP